MWDGKIIDAEFEVIEPGLDGPHLRATGSSAPRGLSSRVDDAVNIIADLFGLACGFAVLFAGRLFLHYHPFHWPFGR